MASLNIRSGWAGRMEAALQELKQGNLDVRFLQETKLMQGIYIRHGEVYNVWVMEAESWHWRGFVVV